MHPLLFELIAKLHCRKQTKPHAIVTNAWRARVLKKEKQYSILLCKMHASSFLAIFWPLFSGNIGWIEVRHMFRIEFYLFFLLILKSIRLSTQSTCFDILILNHIPNVDSATRKKWKNEIKPQEKCQRRRRNQNDRLIRHSFSFFHNYISSISNFIRLF